jgi:hypothetical protein
MAYEYNPNVLIARHLLGKSPKYVMAHNYDDILHTCPENSRTAPSKTHPEDHKLPEYSQKVAIPIRRQRTAFDLEKNMTGGL